MVDYSGYVNHNKGTAEHASIAKMFFSILRHLDERPACPSFGILSIFRPFLLLFARFAAVFGYGNTWPDDWFEIAGDQMSIRDLHNSCLEFNSFIQVKGTSLVNATTETLYHLLLLAWGCFYMELTKKLELTDSAMFVCNRTKEAFNDPDFQNKLESSHESKLRHLERVDGEFIEIALLAKQALDIMIVILQASTIAAGITAIKDSPLSAGFASRSLQRRELPSRNGTRIEPL